MQPATESKEAAQLAARSLALLEKRHGKSKRPRFICAFFPRVLSMWLPALRSGGGALYPVCMTLATLGTLQTPLDEEAVLVYYQRALAIGSWLLRVLCTYYRVAAHLAVPIL